MELILLWIIGAFELLQYNVGILYVLQYSVPANIATLFVMVVSTLVVNEEKPKNIHSLFIPDNMLLVFYKHDIFVKT